MGNACFPHQMTKRQHLLNALAQQTRHLTDRMDILNKKLAAFAEIAPTTVQYERYKSEQMAILIRNIAVIRGILNITSETREALLSAPVIKNAVQTLALIQPKLELTLDKLNTSELRKYVTKIQQQIKKIASNDGNEEVKNQIDDEANMQEILEEDGHSNAGMDVVLNNISTAQPLRFIELPVQDAYTTTDNTDENNDREKLLPMPILAMPTVPVNTITTPAPIHTIEKQKQPRTLELEH